MKSFEIHTMRDGKWAIDSVFNDRELALFEARRVDENGRYAGVRVIEEVYDEVSGLTTNRTIFRGRKSSHQMTAHRKGARKARTATEARNDSVGQERAQRPRSPVAHETKKKSSMLVPVLLAVLLLFLAAGGLLGLHFMAGSIG
jgi:hypothetical protein